MWPGSPVASILINIWQKYYPVQDLGKEEEKTSRHKFQKEKDKVSSFEDNVIVYIESLK